MSKLAEIGASVGSRRYARDLVEGGCFTSPWWDIEPMSASMLVTREWRYPKKHLPDLERTGSNPVMSFKIKVT